MTIKRHIGNIDLVSHCKTAFLSSQKMPVNVVLKSYDWAIEQRETDNSVKSGFHSRLEEDVFHYLLKGNHHIIFALAKRLKKRIEPELKNAVDAGGQLIFTPFDYKIKWVTEKASLNRKR